MTIPNAAPARVKETPPFMRATTSASMDIPGPFEPSASEAYYNMTLPEPTWSLTERGEFMKQWYYAAITNVSVHEVWPGHYLQFLYAKTYPSDVRKVFGAATNSEGWAHYSEQMVLDEGFHVGEPRYRLAQIQDALLRNVRFIVGIKMHTAGHDAGPGGGDVREGRLSAAAGREIRNEARHVRRDVRLLHDGQAHDPEAARRLQDQGRRVVLAPGLPRSRSSRWARCRCRSCGGRCWEKLGRSSRAQGLGPGAQVRSSAEPRDQKRVADLHSAAEKYLPAVR